MIKICFVCLGNICRSPMAEYMMKKKLSDLNILDKFYITSRATSYEEQGNSMYSKAQRKLQDENIPVGKHTATRLEKKDYSKYDYFICMEKRNIQNTIRILGNDDKNKIFCLLDITSSPKDIADPWYTNNFDETYNDLDKGIDKLIELLTRNS